MKAAIYFIFLAILPCLAQTTNAPAPLPPSIEQKAGDSDDPLLKTATEGLTPSLTRPGGINGTFIYYGQVGKTGNTWAWLRNGKLMMMCYPASQLNEVWRLLQINGTQWAEGNKAHSWIIPGSATRAEWDGNYLTLYIDPIHYQTANPGNGIAQVKITKTTNAPASTLGPHPAIGTKVLLTLKDGTVKAGTLAKIDPEGISLLTDDGGGKILFDSMTDTDKATFGYNRKAHETYLANKAALQAADIERGKQNRQWDIDESKREVAAKIERAARAEKFSHQFILTGTVIQFVRNDAPGTLIQQSNMDKEIIFVEGSFIGGHVSESVSLQVASDGWYDYIDRGGENVHARQCLIVPDDLKVNIPPEAPTRAVFPAPNEDQ